MDKIAIGGNLRRLQYRDVGVSAPQDTSNVRHSRE
jgi:hypothetical protein